MRYLLIPSRHVIYSKEQEQALREHLQDHVYDYVVFAITSYNLNNCKYSPVSIFHRINMVDSLIYTLQEDKAFAYKIQVIPHFSQSDDFPHKVVEYCNYHLPIMLTKENTDIFTFGSYVGDIFTRDGWRVTVRMGVDHLLLFKELFVHNNQQFFDENISISSKRVVMSQDEILLTAKKIWLDSLLKEYGSISATRNYHTYTEDMSNVSAITAKYNDIKEFIVEGKIVDEGCADAALFIPIAKDFPDSDLIGVDISNEFIARVEERIREGYFGDSFVTVLQANLMAPIFKDPVANTIICNSTMHEIWSYNNKEASLREYLSYKYDQLLPGGRLLIRDVVGPENPHAIWYMRDASDNNARFKKFVHDFAHVRDEDAYEICVHEGVEYIKANSKIISEYLLHKDYINNWDSEMKEEFCHLNGTSWGKLLEDTSFSVVACKPYTSEWIKEHRFSPSIILLNESLESIDYPHTNIVVVGEKKDSSAL